MDDRLGVSVILAGGPAQGKDDCILFSIQCVCVWRGVCVCVCVCETQIAVCEAGQACERSPLHTSVCISVCVCVCSS